MAAIEIRPANSSDVNRIMKFEHASDTTHVWQMDTSLDQGQIEVRFREIRLPRSLRLDYPKNPERMADSWTQHDLFLVARMNEQLVGYLILDLTHDQHNGRVSDLVVDEAFRRQGIATALLISTQDWLRSRGIYRIGLEMQAKNHSAIALARKMRYDFNGFADCYFANQDMAVFFNANLK
ncbi:MAG: GNAT family N-acetyltransferase [Chloroflexi bacterium]|nr:GNAT family N-acetyltransferase [Chloroflexota bacterium]